MIQFIISVAVVCVYCEVMWKAVLKGHRPYEYMRQILRFMVWLNYGIAIGFYSPYNIAVASTCHLYEKVIYQYRYTLLSGEGSDNDSTGKTEK